MIEPLVIDKETIINWALTKLGVGPVFSIDDDSDLGHQIAATWQPTVEWAFTLTDWSWTKKTLKLNRLADTPLNGYTYAFELPPERISRPEAILQSIRPRALCRDFLLEGKSLYADPKDLWATIRVIIEPEDWDASFRAAFVTLLASALAVPVYADDRMRDELLETAIGSSAEKGAGGMFGRILALDKAAAPVADPLPDSDPLTDARWSGSDPYLSWAGRFG